MCFKSVIHGRCQHKQICYDTSEPESICQCSKLMGRLPVHGYCMHCRTYYSNASFDRNRWIDTVNGMETQHWEVLNWIQSTPGPGVDVIHNIPRPPSRGDYGVASGLKTSEMGSTSRSSHVVSEIGRYLGMVSHIPIVRKQIPSLTREMLDELYEKEKGPLLVWTNDGDREKIQPPTQRELLVMLGEVVRDNVLWWHLREFAEMIGVVEKWYCPGCFIHNLHHHRFFLLPSHCDIKATLPNAPISHLWPLLGLLSSLAVTLSTMCYKFTLYVGCGHDRSLHFFRPEPKTDDCLCRTFSRLPSKTGLCPDCDQSIKVSRGLDVPPDTLTPLNRAKCRAWREAIDKDVKENESKRLSRAAKYASIQNTTVEPVVQKQNSKNRKGSDSQKQRHNSRVKPIIGGVIPPYVEQPGETFVEHIIAEILDDAKSGGEITRLLRAWDGGVQGFGHIGPNGEESWLALCKEWMEKHGDTMDVWTGEARPAAKFTGIPGYERNFPPLGPAMIGNPAIGIPMMPNPRHVSAGQRRSYLPSVERRNTAPANWMGFNPSRNFTPAIPITGFSGPMGPNMGLYKAPLPAIQESSTGRFSSGASTMPIRSNSSTVVLPGLPPLPTSPFLFEKYDSDDETIQKIIDAVKSEGTTPLLTEDKENTLFSTSSSSQMPLRALNTPVSASTAPPVKSANSKKPQTSATDYHGLGSDMRGQRGPQPLDPNK
ncbi:hypothetical protein H072_4249 [Dactylellina haptotyla CBS 200.50]|uniref:Uncharacterized protein n=1 Tax=Dactylellina haptotyla (strain CBS 200.50) TaxID=1284197 RepID=S8AL53_DACHA|nr:hypothetical protein H072_4249 [Dactylellina haptotyla CBS 200.50]